ncbi:peptidoglycan-binding protein [Streptomyces sp. NPDC013953]|uniref:L,D-transpeptidase family protein n=1 Tax=Streptomyces sp. NPDC013953 TaxID=3364868 RepID=UPI0036F8DB87
MHRTSVIRRVVPAMAVVALAATGCTAQAVGADAPSAPPATAGTPSPAADGTKPSATPSSRTSPSESPDASASPRKKVLMAEGTENEQVRELQARLRQAGHFHRSPTSFYGSMTAKAVSSFQRKQNLPVTGTVDEATWRSLAGATRTPTADELRPPTTNELDAPDARCMTGRVLCISKESRTLAWMIDGKVVSAMDVRFGSVNTPTREGIFKVDRKERTWKSTLYHSDMPYSMFFSRGQAVHYSSDFAARGYNGGSHGCVNVRDKEKLAALFDQVKVGDKVVVHW